MAEVKRMNPYRPVPGEIVGHPASALPGGGSTVLTNLIANDNRPQMSSKDQAVTPSVRRLSNPKTLAAELPRWEGSALAANAAMPTQTRAWIVACAETLIRDSELNVALIEDAEGLAALAPMVRRAGFPSGIELLGVRDLSEPSDLIYRDDRALTAIVRELSRDSTPMLLERVDALSPAVEAIRDGYRGKGVLVSHAGNNCPYITLGDAAKDVDQLVSGRLRSDLRRAERRAQTDGKVTYEIHAPRSAAEFLPLFDQALQVEAAGWKGRGGSAVAANERQRAFFTRYGILASEEGILRLAFMRIGGAVTAMQYAVQWNGAFWLLKIGYDEAYSKCSPGMLLIRHTLNYAMEQRLRSYEFLGSAESWTKRWTTTERSTARISVYPFGPSAMFSLGRDVLRAARRKVAARLETSRQREAASDITEAISTSGAAGA